MDRLNASVHIASDTEIHAFLSLCSYAFKLVVGYWCDVFEIDTKVVAKQILAQF